MTLSIREIQQEIVEEFEMLGEDWSERYDHIMEIGRSLAQMPMDAHTEENKVKGCQSNVWLTSALEGDRIRFQGDSDALIVKGLVGLVLRVFDDHTPDEILAADMRFLEEIGLHQHLSPTRSNGLASMIRQIRFYAMAYKAKMSGADAPADANI